MRNLIRAFKKVGDIALTVITSHQWMNLFSTLFFFSLVGTALCLMLFILLGINEWVDYFLNQKSTEYTARSFFELMLKFALSTIACFVLMLPNAIQQSMRKMAPIDHGVNWKRDGF